MSIVHVYFGDAEKHPIVQNYQNNGTEIIDVPKQKNLGRMRRAWILLIKLYNYVKNKNIEKQKQIFHCHDPISLILVLIFISSRNLVFDAHEVYSSYIQSRILRTFAFRIEWILVRIPGKLIFPSCERGEIFFKNESKFVVIENKINDHNIKRDIVSTQLPRNGIQNEINCIFVGTFTDVRACHEIIQAISIVRREGFKINLDLFGAKNSFVDGLIPNLPDYIKFNGQISQRDLFERYADYDIGFALYKPINLNNRYCAPTKIFEHEYFGVKTVTLDSAYIVRKLKQKEFKNCTLANSFAPSDIAMAIKNAHSCEFESVDQESLLWSSQNKELSKLYL